MEGARKILLSITGGRDLSLWEVNEAAKAVADGRPPGREHHLRRDGRREARRRRVLGHGRRDRLRRAPPGPLASALGAPPRSFDEPRGRAARAAAGRAERPAPRHAATWSSTSRSSCRGADGPTRLTVPLGAVPRTSRCGPLAWLRDAVRGSCARAAIRSPRRPARVCCARAATRSTPRSPRCSPRGSPSRCSPARARAATCSSPAPGRSRRCSTSSSRRPGRGADRRSACDAACPSTSTSATRCRSSTSAPRRAACPATRRASRRPRAAGARCRSPSSPRPPARAGARRACRSTAQQAYIFADPRAASSSRRPRRERSSRPPGTRCARATRFRSPELGDTIERLGAEGAAPFYTGDLADARGRVGRRARRDADRRGPAPPTRRSRASRSARATAAATSDQPAAERGRHAARARARAPRRAPATARRALRDIVDAMEAAQAERTPEFTTGLADAGFADAFLASRLGVDDAHLGARRRRAARRGDVHERRGLGRRRARAPASTSTTSWARRTSTRWASTAPRPARRMPSMMAPTVVLRDGEVELVLGCAGLQPHPLGDPADDRRRRRPRAGARARRSRRRACTSRTASSTPSRACRSRSCAPRASRSSRFRDRNVFFGGVQAVERDPATGALTGAGDPRRGGVAVAA